MSPPISTENASSIGDSPPVARGWSLVLFRPLEFGFFGQVSKWRLQFKEAEARLVELTGDKTGDVKKLVWGVGDEERFRGELDEKVGPTAPCHARLPFGRGRLWWMKSAYFRRFEHFDNNTTPHLC